MTPTGRPAGKVATVGWVVMTEGWVVMATSGVGMPVTTPRESVCVRKEVKPLVYGTVVEPEDFWVRC